MRLCVRKKSKPAGRWARIPPGRHPMKGPSKKCLTYEVLLLWARRKVKFSMHVIYFPTNIILYRLLILVVPNPVCLLKLLEALL